MKRREQKQIDVLATARRDRRRVPLPFCLPRPPLSPLSFHTRTWIQGMRKWVPSPTGSGAMPETRSYMTARCDSIDSSASSMLWSAGKAGPRQ